MILQEVFMDISVGGEPAGRIIIGLFGTIVPLTVDNFATLASRPQVNKGLKKFDSLDVHPVSISIGRRLPEVLYK
jgi:cyclophilin family peptidyl-prolyl cis-trans isomerase